VISTCQQRWESRCAIGVAQEDLDDMGRQEKWEGRDGM